LQCNPDNIKLLWLFDFGKIESIARVSAAVEKLTPAIETTMLNFKRRKGSGLWYNLFKIIFGSCPAEEQFFNESILLTLICITEKM
jgi:hypothetical protein